MLKNVIGRPSALDGHISTALRELYEMHGMAAIILTDAELFVELNQIIDPRYKVSYRTFQRYKAHANRYGEEGVPRDIDILYTELYEIMQKFAVKQKMNLVREMMECEPNQVHRYKWILERKFKDFNMKYQVAAFMKEDEEEKIAIEIENKMDRDHFFDIYGNYLGNFESGWHDEYMDKSYVIRRPHEMPPRSENDDMRVIRSRYYEKFKGKTGDHPNKDDVDMYYYWPEGIDMPDWTQAELDAWWNPYGDRTGTPQAKPKVTVASSVA